MLHRPLSWQMYFLFSAQSSCNSDVLVQGIELGVFRVPLHTVYLHSNIVTCSVKVAVRNKLPVKGISLILGNDLAGSKVVCLPVVTEVPSVDENDVLSKTFPNVFLSCVVTCAQARKFDNEIDLADSFMNLNVGGTEETYVEACRPMQNLKLEPKFDFPLDKRPLMEAQNADDALKSCLSAAVDKAEVP